MVVFDDTFSNLKEVVFKKILPKNLMLLLRKFLIYKILLLVKETFHSLKDDVDVAVKTLLRIC
jgi:hypothetical protein